MTYALDTNTISYFIQRNRQVAWRLNMIAAFCIVNNCTLVTDNLRHFEGIDGLTFENWVSRSE